MDNCVNCGRSANEVPVLDFHYKDQELGICSSCLPILIHRPEMLAGKLAGAEHILPGEEDHD